MADWTFVREVSSGESKSNNYMGSFEVFATYQGETQDVWDVFVQAAVQHATGLAQGLWNERGCTWSRSGDSLIMRVPVRAGSRPGNHLYFRYSLLEDQWSWPAQAPAPVTPPGPGAMGYPAQPAPGYPGAQETASYPGQQQGSGWGQPGGYPGAYPPR